MYKYLILLTLLCAQSGATQNWERGEAMGWVPTEVMYGYDSPQAKAERENREWNRKRKICEDLDCYTTDTESHETGDEGYLIITDSEVLEKYTRRAKKHLLACSYFKRNFPKRHEILKGTYQQPHMAISGLHADDGYRIWHQACGEWTKRGHTYYVNDYLNRDAIGDDKYGCYWESTIIHEVLHTSTLVHDTDEQMVTFKKILSECNVLDEITMTRWFYETPITPGSKVTWNGQTTMSYDHRIWNKIKKRAGLPVSKLENQFAFGDR